DEDEKSRESEETKRLLYVALTRARDRLYLASVLKDGRIAPGRGSLAEVLPDSVKALFGRTHALPDPLEPLIWTANSGRTFAFRMCREVARDERTRPGDTREPPSVDDNFGSIADSREVPRVSVTSSVALDADDLQPESIGIDSDDAFVGTLMHRLLQFGGSLSADAPTDELVAFTSTLVTSADRASVADFDAVQRRAVAVWRSIVCQPDVARLLERGERFYEVPFSIVLPVNGDDSEPVTRDQRPGRVLRGTIDCLIRQADGSLTVLEFKSGRPRQSHQEQLDIYVRAARSVFPDVPVTGRLIYPAGLPGGG
ncbi:MAG: PD-(D/E)XK nuclease family protein, partial [Acidobacteria bacterium]|nr:PD-(D/E)XK nuclease family protein [Acidobacteriota bacterium]